MPTASGMSDAAAKLAVETTNGVETAPKKEDLQLDLESFTEEYASYVTVKLKDGSIHRYGILSLIDVPNDEALEALKLDVDIRDQPFDEQIVRTRRQIAILVPDLTPEILTKLSTRQMLRVAAQATGVAKRPTGAETERPSSSESASPEPAPAASTGGATPT